MKCHHLGIAVRSLDKAVACYRDLLSYGLLSGPFDDPVQGVKVCFIGSGRADETPLELVAPLGSPSPVDNFLKRDIGAYHVCYEVDDLDATLARWREKGCRVVADPVPAVAFSGRRIAWLYTPTHQLTELVETSAVGC